MALVEHLVDSISHFPSWLALLLCLLTAYYFYLTWHHGYWKKRGVNGTKPWPLIGNMSIRKMETIEDFDSREYKKHGRVFGAFIGRNPMLFIAEPDLIRKVLVKDFNVFRNRLVFEMGDDIMMNFLSVLKDEEWKNVRNIVTPTFTTGKMKQMMRLMEECSQQLVNHLEKLENENQPIFDARQCTSAFAVDVIATCSFGTKINSLENPDNEFIQNARKVFSFPSRLFILAFISENLFKMFSGFLPDNKLKYFADILEDVIKSRSAESEPRKDFLQLLLEAKLEETDPENDTTQSTKKKILTKTQVLAQAILFLIAGSETTSTIFCLSLYNLALNEDCQEKLIKEIDEMMKNNDTLTYDAIAQMQYLDMVISETLRMYPPLGRVDRVCQVDGYKLTDNIVLNKEMVVGIPLQSMHYDEEFYPNPKVFDPERFTPENRNARDPYTYLPFGHGPRNCVGMRFALLELKIGMIYIFRKFRVKKCSKTEIPFKRDFSVLLQPSSIHLQLEKRK